MYFIGIDIGSTNAKIAVVDENENILKTYEVSTGISSLDSSNHLFDLVEKDGISIKDSYVVATGYGRVIVEKANKTITEITCHAKGACKIFNEKDLIVIDIGGQDTKIVNVVDGNVTDFIMNDKCSAGTGRFLDVMAKTMGITISELVNLARNGTGVTISSLCTVFAESEVIGLIGKAEKKENIANAIIMSIVTKVVGQVNKIDLSGKKVCLTGGLCDMDYIVEMLSEKLNCAVLSNEFGRYAGAIGAAILGIGQ